MKTLTPEQIAELINAGWTPPRTQVIDWSRVACHVPVKVEHPNGKVFLPQIIFKPDTGLTNYEWAPGRKPTLETGLWVPNIDGKQPVPDGVLVEVWIRGQQSIDDPIRGKIPHHAEDCHWNMRGTGGDISAFRVVGLAEGYSYE